MADGRASARRLFEVWPIELLIDPEGCIDQTYVTIRLRIVTPLRSIQADILAENTEVVGILKDAIEGADGIIHTPDTRQSIDIPECAYKEGGFRLAEIVLVHVSIE